MYHEWRRMSGVKMDSTNIWKPWIQDPNPQNQETMWHGWVDNSWEIHPQLKYHNHRPKSFSLEKTCLTHVFLSKLMLQNSPQLSSEIHEWHQDLHAKWHWACRNVTSEKKRPVNRGDVFLAPRFFREGHWLVDQRSPCSKWVGLLDWLLFLGSGFEFAAAGLLERLVNLMHKFILCKNDPLM